MAHEDLQEGRYEHVGFAQIKPLKEAEAERQARDKATEERLIRLEEKFDRVIEILESIERELMRFTP